jgi:zinc transporter, ZIP family
MLWPLRMLSFLETLLLSAIMGFSIYLSLPLLMNRKLTARATKMLLAAAIGILIFLLLDIFSDVAPILYSTGTLAGYGSSPTYDAVLTLSIVAGFFILYIFENRSHQGLSPTKLSLLIALGIGFQNLTEGLVFGSLGVTLGLTGVTLVVLVGFTFQNLTEGFPIASPFLGRDSWKLPTMLGLFLIGGLPTILGGGLGYYYSSSYFTLLFNGIAIGSILYIILPMFKILLRDVDHAGQRIAYMGIFLGFMVGFLVNLF